MRMSDVVGYITSVELRLRDSYNFDFEILPDNDNQEIITVRSKNYPSTIVKIDLSRSRVTASSGNPETDEVNELVNSGFLLGNAFYFIDGHIHLRTDVDGRIFSYRALYNRELRTSSLGKIIPSERLFDRSWYRSQELFLANALHEFEDKEDDWYIEVRLVANYKGPNRVPDSIRLEADIDDAAGYYCSVSASMFG